MKSLKPGNNFYHHKAWKECKAGYLAKVGGLCERCLSSGRIVPAEIVHHKQHLTEENYTDPEIAYGFGNLEALCMNCHNLEHFGGSKTGKRYRVEDGKLIY